MKRLVLIVGFLCCVGNAQAQTSNDVRDLVPTGAEFGGVFELFTEGYNVSGRDARRPSGTARLLLRPYMRFGEAFELTANVLLSTEGNSFGSDGRQRINRFGISPSWSWGSAQIGDFSYGYTPLTYQGIPIRGGALHLEPGWFRFSVLGGVTQRAVLGDASNGSYGRDLYAGRIGIGHTAGSYFDLIAVYADDDVGSLGAEESFADPDSNDVGTLVESSSVTPQQNLVLGAASQLSMWSRKLVWQGEFSGAAYTRDKRAPEIEDDSFQDIPSFITNIFTPRVGSNVDLAYDTNLRMRLPNWDVQGGYKYIGPGYRSLGVGSLLVDRKEIRGRGAFHSRKFGVNLHGSTQRDNVLGQKVDTTRRNMIASMFSYRPRNNLLTTLRANFSTMNRNTQDPDARIDYLNQVWGAGVRVSLKRRWVRSVGADYRLQKADDSNPARSASRFTSHQVVVPVGFQLNSTLLLTPHLGIVWVQTPADGWRVTHTEKLALRHNGMNRRWTTTLSVGTSFDDGSRRLVASANSNFRISPRSSLKFVLRNNVFRARGGDFDDWEELIVRLSLENRW